jgi:ATP-dependent helicase/nuclease subunit B
MSIKTLFTAPPGTRGKRKHIFNELASLCPENDFSSVLYICPNSFIIGEAERDFHDFLKSPAYIPFRTATLRHLATGLCRAEGTVSDRIRPLILCDILNQKNAGYARLLSDLYKKLKHHLPDKDLAQAKDEITSLIFEEKAAGRAGDAIDTLLSYESRLRDRGLVDEVEALKKTALSIQHSAKENPLNPRPLDPLTPSFLVIDGFFDPTPLELLMIKGLISMARNVILLCEEESGIYRHFKSGSEGLRTRKLDSGIKREKAGYHSYPSMEEEAEAIAKTAKGLILEGTDPWRIVLTFPDLKKYLPLLRRVFKKHGVPLSIVEIDLSSSRPLALLENLFACIEEDYPGHDFLSLLTSPDLPGIPAPVKEWAVTYAYRAGIVKGRESWLSLKETILHTAADEDMDEVSGRLDDLQNGINEVIDIIEDLRRKDTLSSFIDALEDALQKLGFFESVSSSPHAGGEDIAEMLASHFTELRNFNELYGPVAGDPGTPLFYLRHMLKDMKEFSKRGDGVRVIPFELAAGVETDELFFGGVIEEDIPSRPMIDPILPEKVKKEMGLPYLEYYLNRQKRYFRRILNISGREPHLSAPSAEGDNLLLPSPFLDWDSVMPPPSLNIFSEEELLVMDGRQRGLDTAAGAYWSGAMIRGKEAWSALKQRTADITEGYIGVTGIDSYRRCPLRFYIERVLGIDVDEPPKFEVETRLWGNLAHKTMEHLYRDGDVAVEEIDKRLFEGLRQALKRFPIGDFWAAVAEEIFRKLMPMLKEQEREIRAEGFVPSETEKKVSAEVNGMRLRGKIDRVDIKIQNTEHRAQNTDRKKGPTVRILDYKTGLPDSRSLQLPLYASMWQQQETGSVEKVGVYSLREGRITWYPSKGTMQEYIDASLAKAEEIVGNIRKGIFPPEPHTPQECRYCYHSPLCERAQ